MGFYYRSDVRCFFLQYQPIPIRCANIWRCMMVKFNIESLSLMAEIHDHNIRLCMMVKTKIKCQEFVSSVGISVYRFFTIFQSADIAGIVIEKISPYRLFPICRLFVDIENVYRNTFHKIYYNYLFLGLCRYGFLHIGRYRYEAF